MPEKRMEAIYAWTEDDGGEGGEGVIVAFMPLISRGNMVPLQHRRLEIAKGFRPIAEAHRRATGHKVRLVRFTRAEDIEELP